MPPISKNCKIITKKLTAKNTYDFTFNCTEVAFQAVPGQFIHILPPGKTLRRPISICETNSKNGTVRIVFTVVGDGTKILAEKEIGDSFDVLGPLGNGFPLKENAENVLLIGGGIGVPPLLGLAKYYGKKASAILGFRSKENVILTEDYSRFCNVSLCTDDGAAGRKGFVTQLLREEISVNEIGIIYSCGPLSMLKAVADIAKEEDIECYVSLEERMACGVGACLVCACKTAVENGDISCSHVCKDGPVFNAKCVVF